MLFVYDEQTRAYRVPRLEEGHGSYSLRGNEQEEVGPERTSFMGMSRKVLDQRLMSQ